MTNNRQFNVRLPDAIVLRIKREAVDRRTYPNAIVRRLLEQHFRELDDRQTARQDAR